MEAWRERALNAAAAIQERSKPLLEKGMKATQSTIAAIKESETVQSMQQSYSSWREREGSSDSEGLPATATKAVDVPPPWSVFGLPLSSLPLTNYAPTLMHRCIEHIALTGSTEQEGIYRLSGGASMVRTLRYSFGSIGSGKEDPGPVALTVDPNASASVLKAFLRELSEPILTTSLLPYFTAIPITPSEDGKASALTLSQLSAFIGKLPLVHYATLRLLLLHLFDVSRNEPVNKMGVSNLAVVFSPSTLIGGDLLKVLIANANLLCKTQPSALVSTSPLSTSPSILSSSPGSTRKAPPPPPPSKRLGSQNNLLSTTAPTLTGLQTQPRSPTILGDAAEGDKPPPAIPARPLSNISIPVRPQSAKGITPAILLANRHSSASELSLDEMELNGLDITRPSSGAERPLSYVSAGSGGLGSLPRKAPPPPPPSKKLGNGMS